MKKSTIQVIATVVVGTAMFLPAVIAATKDKLPSDQQKSINLDMIYMPAKGNGVCNDQQGARNSCMATVRITDANGGKRDGFGVFVGNDLIATDYGLVTGQGDGYAVKPDDGHTYTIYLSDGTERAAKPWAFVPGAVAVLRMQ